MKATKPLCALLLLVLARLGAAGDVTIDDFEGAVKWTHNPDGGTRVEARRDTEHVKSGKAALRLVYRDAAPHWANLQHPVTVPPEATAVALWLRVHAAEPKAAMHFWLFEPDGDGWLVRVLPRGKSFAALGPGWHEVVVPIGRFRFQPRGNRRRQLLTVNKMLIGCNFASLDVTLDRLRFLVTKEAAVSELPRTKSLRIERGKEGNVAILADDLPTTAGAADPAKLAALAREMGYGATLLKAGDAADPTILDRKNFDVLIVPCAPAYPRKGRDALLRFLKAGGSLVSIGGYAFDSLLYRTQDGWSASDVSLIAKDMDKAQPQPETINTRYGRPGDTMGLRADQVGAFDPSYLLQHVAYAKTAPSQELLKDNVRIEGRLDGYAACAMTGSNSPVFPEVYGRWTPILNAYDSLGRLRGAAAAVVRHWRGPFAGSSWALFGVTNHDLFAEPQHGAMLLRAALRATVGPIFLHGAKTELACYRQGETVQASVQITNGGPAPRDVLVQFECAGREPVKQRVAIAAGKTQVVSAPIHNGTFDRDFVRVTVRLLDAKSGERLDRMDTAFVVWDEKVIRSGPKIALKDNYFAWNGVPRFFCGTNQTGMMWHSEHEGPQVWERDFAAMQAHGIRMLRILHFSPFAADDPPKWRPHGIVELLKKRPKRLLRQTDAIVQLAQKHGVAIFLVLHDWMPVALSDAELAAQRHWNRFWAERYRNVPGIIYDVQNEPKVGIPPKPDIVRLYNDWLKGRYKAWDALRDAWGQAAPIGKPWSLKPEAGSNKWADVKTFDANRFKVQILNRWVRANVQGVKEGDPDALVAVGYLPSMPPADKVLGVAHTDFSNMHYYGPVDRFAQQFKIIDRRFVGKSFSLGEFGAREAHDARTHGATGTRPEVSAQRFLATTHYAFGLGASFALNWDWKDFDDCVFPWGLTHPCDQVPKRVLIAYRNTALFLERLKPKYEDPALYLLLPDSHRLGGKTREVHEAIFRSIDALIANHVNFNVANEHDLDKLPARCKAIVWPVPYCPQDDAFERVAAFVKRGGALYFSGDVAYDPLRRRTRAGRFAQLGLKDPGEQPPFGKATRPHGETQRTNVGKGKVFFVPRPIELERGPLNDTLREFLKFAGLSRIQIAPDDPRLHVFTIPLEDGEATVVVNRTGRRQEVRTAGVSLAVDAAMTALVAKRSDGRLVALECSGQSAAEGKPITSGSAHVMIASLDGEDIRRGGRLVLFPITEGRLTVHTAGAWKKPILEVGEFDGGVWRSLASHPLAQADAALSVEIRGDLQRSILIIRERDAEPGLKRSP